MGIATYAKAILPWEVLLLKKLIEIIRLITRVRVMPCVIKERDMRDLRDGFERGWRDGVEAAKRR